MIGSLADAVLLLCYRRDPGLLAILAFTAATTAIFFDTGTQFSSSLVTHLKRQVRMRLFNQVQIRTSIRICIRMQVRMLDPRVAATPCHMLVTAGTL